MTMTTQVYVCIYYFEDDVLPDVIRNKIQFLERLELENIDRRTRDLMLTISSSIRGERGVKTNDSMVDLSRDKKKIDDSERADRSVRTE